MFDTESVNIGSRIVGNISVLGFFFGVFKYFLNRLDKRFLKLEDALKDQEEYFEAELDKKADISELKELKKENKEDHKLLFEKVDNLPFKIIELLKFGKVKEG